MIIRLSSLKSNTKTVKFIIENYWRGMKEIVKKVLRLSPISIIILAGIHKRIENGSPPFPSYFRFDLSVDCCHKSASLSILNCSQYEWTSKISMQPRKFIKKFHWVLILSSYKNIKKMKYLKLKTEHAHSHRKCEFKWRSDSTRNYN